MITNILNSIIFPIELLLASYICAVRINKRSYWGLRMVLSFLFRMRIYGSCEPFDSGKYAYQRIYRIFKHYTPQRIAFILDL